MNYQAHISLLYNMLFIRRVEEMIANEYSKQEMRCPVHLCIGQEAIAVGVCSQLNKSDFVYSNHRSHGHYLAKGGDLKSFVAELFGRTSGCSGGRGGSMHLIDKSVGFLGSTPIVGGTVPLSVGTAWASKLLNDNNITVIFFGDGCFEEGVLHESMNFASLHKLPILFVCENNNYSVYTPLSKRQPSRSIVGIANAHGIVSCSGNGNDISAVEHLTKNAIYSIRGGYGPYFLELNVYRWREHCGPNYDNDLNYRSAQEIESGHTSCPIENYKQLLFQSGSITHQMLSAIENEIDGEIHDAFRFARMSPLPSKDDAKRYLYA